MRDFAGFFDQVFCISLPESSERRAHIAKHFRALGIDRYRFFDATGKDDPAVLAMYDKGRVARYPPCFRCGALTCGRDDCNNLLIPAQVATFLSYVNLWTHIVETETQTALIVEDDVVFTTYAPRAAEAIMRRGLLDQTGLKDEAPVLIRMGWAGGPEHKATGRVDLEPDLLRMSDPCHAINLPMARRLLSAFDRIDTTVDVFTHKNVGQTVPNYTVMPPLALELSWSLGAVESLIHPKAIRVAYLKKHHPERVSEIEAAVRSVEAHASHVLYRDLLVTGHPRCGSGYMSQLLKSYGLDVGHEHMGAAGIASWMFAVEDERNPFALDPLAVTRRNTWFGHTIHFVRDPLTAIPSIVRENRHSEQSLAFRRKHIERATGVDLDAARTEVEKALLSYLHWNRLIEAQTVDLRVQVEAAEEVTRSFLEHRRLAEGVVTSGGLPPKTVNSEKLYQGVLPERTQLSDADWHNVRDTLKDEIDGMCHRFGYAPLYG